MGEAGIFIPGPRAAGCESESALAASLLRWPPPPLRGCAEPKAPVSTENAGIWRRADDGALKVKGAHVSVVVSLRPSGCDVRGTQPRLRRSLR